MASVHTSPLTEQWCSRMGALALTALMLLGACVPVASPGGRLTVDRRWTQTPRKLPQTGAAPGEEREAVFARLPTSFAPVRVDDAEFKSALVTWVLEVPLRVAFPTPVRSGGGLAPGTGGSGEESWQAALVRSYGQLCERRGTPGDCLTLLEDEPHLQADDKRGIASIREGITGSDTLTVRKWLSTQSYEAQRQFGLKAIENIRRGIWKVR